MMKELAAPPRIVTDFASDDFRNRPHEHYAAWQRATPVFTNQLGMMYLTRYDDCAALLSGKEFRLRFAENLNAFGGETGPEANPFDRMIGHWLVFMDPPRHDVVRQVLAPLFTTRALAPLEPRIRGIAQRLARALRDRETADAVALFASPLPMLVMCELIGLPAADHASLVSWSDQLSYAVDCGDAAQTAPIPASLALCDYFEQFLAAVARGAGSDFSRAFLAAADAGVITRDEVLFGLTVLIWAGHETSRNLLGNGMLALSEHPSQLRLLKERPDLMPDAVEELLRYTSPVQKVVRWTSAPAEFSNFRIPEAALVVALVGAANRDPAVFQRPHDLDLRRAPNRHLSFGRGLHACLGALLARMEGRVAFEALAAEFTEIGARDYRWRNTHALRALDYLAVRPT